MDHQSDHLLTIISGGQTGVDQAALQAALDMGIPHSGWCPPGRVCTRGLIPERFNLTETPLDRHPDFPTVPRSQRTLWNVRDSDGSLIINQPGLSDPGTVLTIEAARQYNKPVLQVMAHSHITDDVRPVVQWILEKAIHRLNVAGPSEETAPDVYETSYALLVHTMNALLPNHLKNP